MDLAAEAREVLGVDGDQVGVHHRQHLRQHLEHCHLAAEGGEHRGELHADHAAADDGEPLRHLVQLEDLVGVDRELGAFQGDARDGRAGGDHDVLGLEAIAGDVDHAVPGQHRRAADLRHAACLEQAFDALDQLIDNAGLSLLGGAPVEADML